MADIWDYQSEELEYSSHGMEDEYGKMEEQQGETSDNWDAEHRLMPLDQLFYHAMSTKSTERQMVGKILITLFQNAVNSNLSLNIDKIFQPIDSIVYDRETAVRSSLVECLPHVALICQDSLHLFKDLTSRILDIVLIYLRDEKNQVRQDAQTALKILLERKILDDNQIQEDVCSVILELSHSQSQEIQTLALTLMTKVNPYIGNKVTEKLFLDRFLELCTNESAFIRRVCASIIGEFCAMMMSKETIYNKLLPMYVNLCKDMVWCVRKTSADVMMSVASCLPLEMRRHVLSQILVKHLCDDSRWVCRSAYEILGPFISTFAKEFHELILDKKGELFLIHEKERGWPRFNVVPIAKTSDILTENLTNDVSFEYTQSPLQQDSNDKIEKKRHKKKECDQKMYVESLYAKFKEKLEFKKTYDSHEHFNLFQYYYDPPDMPLDPQLVNSIISDKTESENSKSNSDEIENTNIIDNRNTSSEKRNAQEELNNENLENTNEEQEEPSNENNDNTEEQCQDNNENWENNEEQQFDKNNVNESDERRFPDKLSKRRKKRYRLELNVRSEKDAENESRSPQNSPAKINQKSYYNAVLVKANKSNSTMDQSPSSYHLEIDKPFLLNYNIEESDEKIDKTVPLILVNYFVSMSEFHSSSDELYRDINYHCAFSFPAVVLTVGRENWYRLKDAYQRLAGALIWKVRSTLASSIHEIAIIIGKEYTARDLVPIYNGFIKDLDEVRIGALKHLSTFLKVLSEEDRKQYLNKFNDFLKTDNNRNWRLREELVKQLSEIIHLYEPKHVAEYIAPILLLLMQERVSAVRLESLNAIAKVLAYLDGHRQFALKLSLIQKMKEVLISNASDSWMMRQTYALACSKLLANNVVSCEVFARELLPCLLQLVGDRVPNVRLVVARTLATQVVTMHDFSEQELMNEVHCKLKMMQSDIDRDVRIFASEADI